MSKRNTKTFIVLGLLMIMVIAGAFLYVDKKKGEIIPVSKQELIEMFESKKSFIVYIGSPDCMDCQDFYPEFEEKAQGNQIKIYYFNTKARAGRKNEIRKYVRSMGVKEIPAILEIDEGRIVTMYDGQDKDDMEKFYRKFRED